MNVKIIAFGLAIGIVGLLASDCLAQRKGGRKGRDRGGDTNALKVGQEAPEFTLKSLDGESETELSSFRDEKPVVLFFGSYT